MIYKLNELFSNFKLSLKHKNRLEHSETQLNISENKDGPIHQCLQIPLSLILI